MRNTNKNAFFLFYFHNGVPWTARSKVVNISETPKEMAKNFLACIFGHGWGER